MRLLDVHAHFVPDAYREALLAAGHGEPDGMPAIPGWRAEDHVRLLDRVGIRTALLSISSPGVHFGDDAAARELAHVVNVAGRDAAEAHPGRFGLLAALPLPDVDGALAELRHAFDELHADGVALLTNAGGTYLGDPSFEPLFAELDRRHARVFIHPTSPPCWQHTALDRPRPMVEFLFDTTRAVTDLVLGGTVARHPNIAFIVPHAGAALPVLADRIAAFSHALAGVEAGVDVARDLAGLHYDLAGFPLPRQLAALLAVTTVDQLHYGSDHPFTPAAAVVALAAQLGEHGDLLDRLTANTERLFPGVAGRTRR